MEAIASDLYSLSLSVLLDGDILELVLAGFELRHLARVASTCATWHRLSQRRLRLPDWRPGGRVGSTVTVCDRTSCALDEDGEMLVTTKADGDERILRLVPLSCVDEASHHQPRRLYGHTKPIRCIAIHRKVIVSGANFGELLLWRMDSESEPVSLCGHVNDVTCVAIRGSTIASVSAGVAKVWAPAGAEWGCVATVPLNSQTHSLALGDEAACAGGGEVLALGAHADAEVWPLADPSCDKRPKSTLWGRHKSKPQSQPLSQPQSEPSLVLPHGEPILSLVVDGNLLATGCVDHVVRTWDLRRGVCTRALKANSDIIFSVGAYPAQPPALHGTAAACVRTPPRPGRTAPGSLLSA
jgi:WD40 repeat protein